MLAIKRVKNRGEQRVTPRVQEIDKDCGIYAAKKRVSGRSSGQSEPSSDSDLPCKRASALLFLRPISA